MTDTTVPAICPECGNLLCIMPDGTVKPGRDREAEYRRVWLEVAMQMWIKGGTSALQCLGSADIFLAELKKRDGA